MMTVSELLALGLIRRFHAHPIEDIRPQTVAEHSWGVAFLITKYHPHPSAELLKAAIVHDLGEVATGDIPAHVKWDNPTLAGLVEYIEARWLKENVYSRMAFLTENEKIWLTAADIMELFLFARRRNWTEIVNRCWGHMKQLDEQGLYPKELVFALDYDTLE